MRTSIAKLHPGTKSKQEEQSMKSKLFRFLFLTGSVLALGTAVSAQRRIDRGERHELRADRREVRVDTREIRSDRREIRQDGRERNADVRELRQDRREDAPLAELR